MKAKMPALKDVSLADQAYEMLRSAVLDGVFQPSEKFTIEDVAARLGISRTPVREALKALQSDGLVRLLPHRGAMVEQYALDEIRNRYVITAMLEGYAAELACKADAAGLAVKLLANCKTLEEACEGLTEVTDEKATQLTRLNREFHQLIRDGSGSPTLVRLLETLRQPTHFALNYWKSPETRKASLRIHRRIAMAFAKGDPGAARLLLEEHLMEAFERILKKFAEAGEAVAAGTPRPGGKRKVAKDT